jgi:hypothetical protein
LEYVQAVAAANTELARGRLGCDGHAREMAVLWRRFGAEHDPARWGAVVHAADLLLI